LDHGRMSFETASIVLGGTRRVSVGEIKVKYEKQ